WLKTQDHVLAWQSRWQRLTVRALHREREDVCGFSIDSRHLESAESWCGRTCGRFGHESCVSACPAQQQCLERRSPSGRKRLYTQCAIQEIARMIGRVEKRIDLRDSHSLLRLSDLHAFVAFAHLAFLQDAEVEPRAS